MSRPRKREEEPRQNSNKFQLVKTRPVERVAKRSIVSAYIDTPRRIFVNEGVERAESFVKRYETVFFKAGKTYIRASLGVIRL